MKNIKLFSSLLFLVLSSTIYSQEKMVIEGAIIIANSEDPSPEAGTIRWSGTDFEGWNGSEWLSMTGGKKYVKDIDNNSYEIVTIGTQTWMSENLRTSRYNNGVTIPLRTDQTAQGWGDTHTPGYSWYDNGEFGTPPFNAVQEYGALATYGGIYNYYVVTDPNGHNVCPIGWHVPNEADWTTLIAFLGFQAVAGGKMKETGLAHWNEPNTDATNSSGFGGVAGGYRVPTGHFAGIGSSGYYWRMGSNSDDPQARILDSNSEEIFQQIVDEHFGCSIRCVKD